jgi:hypothetical protein
MNHKKQLKVIIALIFGFIASSFLVMLTWNLVVPSVFSLSQISIYQSFGIVFLFDLFNARSKYQTRIKRFFKYKDFTYDSE